MLNHMPMTTHRSKLKQEIEFQYAGHPFYETGSSFISTVDWDISSKFGTPIENQNWPTNGDNIAIWMTKPLFKIQSVTNKQTKQKHQTFVSHVAVKRRISTKLCMKIEDVSTIFASPLIFSIQPVVSELGDSENFGGKCPSGFCL